MTVRAHRLVFATGMVTGLLVFVLLAAAASLVAGAGAGASSPTCAETGAAGATPASAAALREIPSRLVAVYQQASAAYRLGPDGWAWLAAVNRIETDFGRDLSTSSAGAVGWMQFEPATWAAFGVDADGDGRRDPYDPADAIAAAARYLAALGAPADWERAIRAYNGGPGNARAPATLAYWQSAAGSAAAYLGTGAAIAVAPGACEPCPPADTAAAPDPLAAAGPLGRPPAAGAPPMAAGPGPAALPAAAPPALACAAGGAVPLAAGDRARIGPDGLAAAPAAAPPAVRAMIAAGNQLIGKPYVYGGGHADFRLAAGYDCSSSVSWSLHAAGYLAAPEDSTTLEGFGDPGAGLWVTVYANPGHAFVYVAGIRLDTSPQAGDGRFDQAGPRWRPATRSTGGFVARHPPGL